MEWQLFCLCIKKRESKVTRKNRGPKQKAEAAAAAQQIEKKTIDPML